MRAWCALASAALTLLFLVATESAPLTYLTAVAWTTAMLLCVDVALTELMHSVRAAEPSRSRSLNGLTLPTLAVATGTALPIGAPARVLLLQALIYAAARPLSLHVSRPRHQPLRVALVCSEEEAAAVWNAARAGAPAAGATVMPVLQIPLQREVLDNGLSELAGRCAREDVDVVLVGRTTGFDDDVSRALRSLGPDVRKDDLTSWFEQRFERTPLEALDPAAPATVTRPARARRMLGRAGSVAAGLPITLVVVLLLPLVAAAILLESGRPVLFRQRRLGLDGRPFEILKFRTMRQDAEAGGAQFACDGDTRVTRVGRFLRRTRIDELPQVVNILRGEMALIGPRPERPEFVEEYEQCLPGYSARLAVLPGVTGWAQVTEGYTSSVEGTRRKLERDLFYVRNRSLSLNLRILGRTLACVLRMSGR